MLTDREVQVVNLVKQGYSNQEIGRLLNCTTGTVKQHLNHIFKKLDIKTRYQLIVFDVTH